MDTTQEATQLLAVLIVLIVAYFGVMVWTRRVKNRSSSEGGGGGGGFSGLSFLGGGAKGGAGSAVGEDNLAGTGEVDGMGIPASKGPKRKKARFELKGRDAEMAAKVLKRMLHQDPRFQGREEGKK